MTQDYNVLLGQVIMAFTPLYFILQILFPLAFRGGWRIAALAPLIGFVPALIISLQAFSQNSNLWPIAVIFFAPLGCLYLLLLAAARMILGRRRVA